MKYKKIITSIVIFLVCLSFKLNIVEANSKISLSSNQINTVTTTNYSYKGSFFTGLFIAGIIVVVIIIFSKKTPKDNNIIENNNSSGYIELNDDFIKTTGLNKEELKKVLFNIYKNSQILLTNLDKENLSKYMSLELCNYYKNDIDSLISQKNKHVIKELELLDEKIIFLNITEELVTIEIYLKITKYDYVMNKEHEILSGDANSKNNYEYLLTFIKQNSKDIRQVVCQSCGAKAKIISSGNCEYCGSTIVVKPKEYIINQIKTLN